jgi:hypothetical protein
MMQRIGFRRLLPFVFTVMHIAVVLYGMEHQGQSRPLGALQRRYVPAVYQEDGVKWDPVEPKPLTTAQKLGLLLNLPSLLLAIPLAMKVFDGSDMGLLYAALPFVPIVWYGIGHWVDTTVGYVKPQRRLPRSLSGFFAVIATGLLVVSVMTVTPINHHPRPDTYWVGTAMVMWSGLSLAMSLTSFYRRPCSWR